MKYTLTRSFIARLRSIHQPPRAWRALLSLASVVTPSLALAQDAMDGGVADAYVPPTFFEDGTELNFPTPPCGDPADPDAEGCYTNFLVLTDLENDGDMDIVYANGGGYYQVGDAEPSVVYLNDGKGSFRDATDSTFMGAVSRLRQVAIGDVDGDGDRDIYQPGGYGQDLDKLWIQTSPGVFQDRAMTSLPPEMLLLDGGVGTSVPAGGDGGPIPVGLRSKAASAHFGDLDGDGDLDLAVGDWQDNRRSPSTETIVRLYENDGTGSFTALPLDATPPPLPGPRPGADAAVGTWPDGGLKLPLWSSGPLDLDMQDIDGDWDLDLLVIGRNGQSRIFFNEGGFVFSDGTAGYPPKNGPYQYNQELCDIDNDGDLDLLVDNSGGIVGRGRYVTQVNINDGKGFFSDETALRVAGEPGGDDNAVKCADIDGDGNFDLITASLTVAGEKLLLNDGSGKFVFAPNAFPALEDPSLGIDAADINGDGFLDIVTGQGEGEPRIDRLYLGYGMSGKDVTPPKFRAVKTPTAMVDRPIALLFAVSDAHTSETGEFLETLDVEYEIDGIKETLPAYFVGGDLFRVDLPAQPAGTLVKVNATAVDKLGQMTVAPAMEIMVGVAPPDEGLDPGADPGTDPEAPPPAPGGSSDAGVPPTGPSDAGAPPEDERDGDDGCSVSGDSRRPGSGVLFMLGLAALALRRTQLKRRLRTTVNQG